MRSRSQAPDASGRARRPRSGPVGEIGQVRNGETHRDCPFCATKLDTLTGRAFQAATLTSVFIDQLFSSPWNADKKLLAFSDSVQDASHRAGVFGARTWRFNIRVALARYLLARDPCSLAELATAFSALAARRHRGVHRDVRRHFHSAEPRVDARLRCAPRARDRPRWQQPSEPRRAPPGMRCSASSDCARDSAAPLCAAASHRRRCRRNASTLLSTSSSRRSQQVG